MAIASTIEAYLRHRQLPYDTLCHAHTATAFGTARAAHIDAHRLAKSVIVEDDDGYVMAVIPAAHRLHLGQLNRLLDRRLGLATEPELRALFPDCEPGAVPALGQAYHLPTVVDDALTDLPEVYFDAGDHEALIHLGRGAFQTLMHDARHGRISQPAE